MAFLRTFVARSGSPASSVVGATRSFRSAALLRAGKESALGQEGRAEEAEHHKQDQLQKQKEGKGQWKDELASDSESIVRVARAHLPPSTSHQSSLQRPFNTAVSIKNSGIWYERILVADALTEDFLVREQVKADRGEIDASEDTIKKLQEETAKLAQKK
ncbi:hypothetical protein LTR66_004145 [Elasticomyces elasticus]|nr:hypothetical protein LTR66_004145 [Elasticomyces elasticus]KAK5006234.1 hypothetical protein LTR28_006741 [Elasticomyces elasticus]